MLNSKSYHGYTQGESVPIDEIVHLCEKRIRHGHIYEKSIPEKQAYVDVLKASGHEFLVWSPRSLGWGASPFNLNCWRTPEGNPLQQTSQSSKQPNSKAE